MRRYYGIAAVELATGRSAGSIRQGVHGGRFPKADAFADGMRGWGWRYKTLTGASVTCLPRHVFDLAAEYVLATMGARSSQKRLDDL